ncbi:hypothetical protein U8527_21080 [Kordia algicida OT-1]|uniref:Uncharacterized protein n=1 Tax=Kordia algicida OT-1 TaxID=391587 RepID=A9DL83_9FLAO|nr:hypothetical protein [Kordia algicida]EDP98503.1 hypothetical protein KAOT1_14837 [Kordia algicida OT-1]
MFPNRGINITEEELFFEAFPLQETGKAMYCESFRILLKNIKHISISTRYVLDNDGIFIEITGKDNKIYKIPYTYKTEDFEAFEKHFEIHPIYQEELKLECGDYTGKINKIIYPQELYWQDIPEKNRKLTLQSIFTMFYPSSILGNFNRKLDFN